MSFIRVSAEQRLALACAADRPRTRAEALVAARLADESGMPGSAVAWRAMAALADPDPTGPITVR